ncbi:DUF1540 domain-containing protein [Paenibacillus sp. ACRRX]|uniref:DUF1540 domain-containing protein n=1 Tax=unclassified Paenibacillus TaxID=185978 RepID=UPI001EF53B0B|nr:MULTISPECIES: DUF1540 domain-containing protein [unclassified Paenibacillus]MCG7407829.1 DUF1540 domain-containing protein [Paenibacillus sp. ACRRX]MDK8180972.1 DUF1540 domain-containing protein [Paenibacillus sp. UMB4589-SE434]
MSSEKPLVRCSVANCHFWGQGNLCQAESIQIDIDAHATKRISEEYAADLGELHQDQAATSSVTCCHTFKPKSK